jgi:hypothetical protein
MRSQTWKSCVGVLCLLAAGTANAAKLSFSDKGFIDVGALIQTQFRMVQDGSPDKQNPSYDFLFARSRILISGQFDEHIGFIINTDVTYGAATIGGPTGGVAWNNNIYLLDAVGSYKVAKELILDTGLLVLPFSHNELTSGGKYGSVTRFSTRTNAPFSPNSNRGLRDLGVQLRGLVLDDRLYYRIGVYNGVQGGTSQTGSATNGLATGTTTVNGGDAPAFAGMLRFNIAGKEDGYAFCQVCFASSPIVSIGASGYFQNNAIRPLVPTGPGTSTYIGQHSWTTVGGDVFADIPFSADLELSADVLFQKYFIGDGAVPSGNDLYGFVHLRFGQFGIYGQFEWFDSETKYVGKGNTLGDLKVYRGGLNWFVYQHVYKITAEVSFQDKEQAGNTVDATAVPPNVWTAILQFQATF